ncbi:hypothetical protein [Winogradskyella algicola]|uniref:hypothetical protein n=1 Tax=Winogradskyella algicola TaxID=2575815 RepID=UPI001108B240|nr:hypothetical protein [Winogradskyella algicola]
MIINVIGSVLVSLITGIVFWYSETKSNKKLKKEITDRYSLKANLVYKIVGIVCIIIGVILVNVMILNWNEEIKVIAPIVASIFLISGTLITMFYDNYRVEFDELRIIITNWLGKKKTFYWNEIIKINLVGSIKCLKIKSKTKQALINQDTIGFISFMEMMELKTGYSMENLKS